MDISCIEDFLKLIEGIESCKILGNQDEILEIHILSDGSRSPKQISRDIETAIVTKFDIRIDRKIISIVQFKGTEIKLSSRIEFQGVTISTSNNSLEIVVKLLHEEREYFSKQTGVNTLANRNRLISEATLRAVEEIIGQPNTMFTDDIVISSLTGHTIVTALIAFKLGYMEETLVGSAVARSDNNEAIARATLDAVNRRIKGIKL